MSLMTRAMSAIGFGKKSATVTFKVPDGSAAEAAQVGSAGEVVSARSSMSLSAVWACANLISGSISSLPFEVYRKGANGSAEVEPDHPLHSVIYEAPNFDQTALDFWDFMTLSIELWGNAYASISRRSDGSVRALYPIHPEVVVARRLTNGRIEYRYTDEGKNFTKLDRDILHVRGPGGNPLGGMSTLRFGLNAMSAALAADRASAGMFKNGLRPSAVISFDEWLTPENRAIAEANLAEKYLGAVNAGKPFIAEGGMKYDQISIKPEDAQMLETRQFSIEEICRFFQVPPALIGHAGASTAWPSSVEQQMLMFTKFYLRRRVKRLEQAVRQQLLSAEDKAGGYKVRINMDGMMRGDTAARASYYQTMTQIGAMTINEVCDLENLPRKPGGDVPRMQMQNIPITDTGGSDA